jgi:hypothetical protein
MKKDSGVWASAIAGMAAALILNSCAYDPNYMSTSVGGSYRSGYGQGYGYGGDSFSTSVFVGTGNPRWGYDPGCYSYYDYNRRAYYDPYLNGYYPIGYRPPVVYGISHPYGWRPGLAYCRPPSRVTNVTISNYGSREASYRNAGYITRGRTYGQRTIPNYYNGGSYQDRRSYQQPISPYSSPMQRENYNAPPPGQDPRSGGYHGNKSQQGSRYPSRYNNPVDIRETDLARGNRSNQGDPRGGQRAQQATQNQVQQLAPPDRSGENRPQKQKQERKTLPQLKAELDARNAAKYGN